MEKKLLEFGNKHLEGAEGSIGFRGVCRIHIGKEEAMRVGWLVSEGEKCLIYF